MLYKPESTLDVMAVKGVSIHCLRSHLCHNHNRCKQRTACSREMLLVHESYSQSLYTVHQYEHRVKLSSLLTLF